MFNGGISKEGDLIDVATDKGVLTKSGAFFSFGDIKLGQGRENAKAFLKEHKDVADQIESMIKEQSTPQPSAKEAAEEPVTVAASNDGN